MKSVGKTFIRCTKSLGAFWVLFGFLVFCLACLFSVGSSVGFFGVVLGSFVLFVFFVWLIGFFV